MNSEAPQITFIMCCYLVLNSLSCILCLYHHGNCIPQDLVQKMLHVDPQKRVSLQQVLNHSWIAHRDQLPQLKLTLQEAALVKVPQ